MISFIIPARNEEKAIAETLAAISEYKGPREIIVSDDGSTDNTVKIAKTYADIVINHKRGEHPTIGANRNVGAKAAHGDYFVFLDADIFVPNADLFFKKALALFVEQPKLIALTCRVRVRPDLETAADRAGMGLFNSMMFLRDNVLHTGAASGEFQMIQAEFFKKLGGFDESLSNNEDMELFQRLTRLGRTKYVGMLTVYSDGRRMHTLGWPKLLWQWTINAVSLSLTGKVVTKIWQEIR